MKHRPWLWGALAALAHAGLVLVSPWSAHLGLFLVLVGCACLACWGCARSMSRFLPILAGAVLWRALFIPLAPSLSDDIYRYVWEGRVQAAGFDPYVLPPDSPQLEPLRDTDWSRINHPQATAIYPPLAQLIFRCLAALGGVTAFKIAFVFCDLCIVGLLAWALRARRLPAGRLALYAWNPLVTVEVAGSGHLEPLALLPLVVAVLCIQSRNRLAWSAVAASLGVKYAGLAVVPFLLRERRPSVAALVAAVLLLAAVTLPFVAAGAGLVASLQLYAAKWRFNDLLFWPLAARAGSLTGGKMAAAALGLGVLATLLHRRVPLERAALCLFAALLLLSPTVHPWYLLWAVVFLPLVPSRLVFLWSGSIACAYLFLHPAAGHGPCAPTSLVPRLGQVLPCALLALPWLRRPAAGLEAA